jgi:hypothetical protein
MSIILEPSQFEIIEDEVNEEETRALSMLSAFIERNWQRFDESEPTIDDYYKYI